jgi:SagB-type dehydrogenase family enzyme
MMNWIAETEDWPGCGVNWQIRLADRVHVERDAEGSCFLAHPWGGATLTGMAPEVIEALGALENRWVGSDEIWSLIAASADASTAVRTGELLWLMDKLAFLFRLQLVRGMDTIAVLEPVSATARLRPPPLPMLEGARFSGFAYFRAGEKGLVLESALSAYRIVFTSRHAARLAIEIDSAPSADEAPWMVALLHSAGMLQQAETAQAVGVNPGLAELAEFHDLLFHQRSRFGHHDQPMGATYPFLDTRGPLAAVATLPGPAMKLPTLDEAAVARRDMSVTRALEQRRSTREFGAAPLSIEQLAEFLFRCARVKGLYGPIAEGGMPYEVSERPYPSGGGSYELELYLVANRVEDLKRDVYLYAPDQHGLVPCGVDDADMSGILLGAQRASGASAPPPVMIVLTSRFGRLAWKYRSISYAVTLKNVGVLYQTMYMVATSMGLAACALGSGDDLATERALHLVARAEIPVGEFMLGPRPEGETSAKWHRSHPTWRSRIAPAWGG